MNLIGTARIELLAKSLILRVYDVLARHRSKYSFWPSSTNQTGIEIVFPDFLPITLILIWR
jgi:hypothetical protein